MVHTTWLLADNDCYLAMSACAQYGANQLLAENDCYLSMSACIKVKKYIRRNARIECWIPDQRRV